VLKSCISVHKGGLHVAYIDETNKTLLSLTAKCMSVLIEYFQKLKYKVEVNKFQYTQQHKSIKIDGMLQSFGHR
jgi:hypothetical protein